MSLEKTTAILTHALEHKYGVAAFNTFNYETVKWAIIAAEQECMPVIVQLYPGFAPYIPLEFVSHMAKKLAEKASVPVGVHLDHSASYEIAVDGIKSGFPSIMVDGSSLPYEENVKVTAAVVRTARIFDVDVEAELGHVGSGANADDITNRDHYTDPGQAADFVERTGCDFLAVAVGNAHGPYVQTPKLDFERIKAIRKSVNIPLVLHGCSDIPDGQIHEAVNLGMSKFNLGTEYFRAYYQELESGVAGQKANNAFALIKGAEEAMVEFARAKIRLLNPNNFTL